MAKKPVKKAAPVPGKKPVKPAAKAAPKSASVKPSASKKPVAKAMSKSDIAKAAAPKSSKSVAKPVTKHDKKTAKVPEKPAKPATSGKALATAKSSTASSKSSSAAAGKDKVVANAKQTQIAPVAVEGKSGKKADEKNAAKAGPAKTAPAKPGAKLPEPTKPPEPNKTGRPMLLQGPIAIRPMGKKATLAPTPPKPKEKPVKRRLLLSGEPAFVVVQPPTKAVATSEKAAKNKAGLSQKDLDFFRDLLLAKRRELVGDMSSMEREALRENSSDLSNLPVHMADQGTDAYEQEFTLHLVEKDRGLLRELNDALAKIQNGTYGICEGTGLPISKARLEAQPWARHSIEHARALEKRQMMFRR